MADEPIAPDLHRIQTDAERNAFGGRAFSGRALSDLLAEWSGDWPILPPGYEFVGVSDPMWTTDLVHWHVGELPRS